MTSLIMVILVVAARYDTATGGEMGRAEGTLAVATGYWSSAVVVRTYKSDSNGQALVSLEGAILSRHGYRLGGQSGEGGHFKAGTFLVSGAVGLAVSGGTHTKGKLTLTYVRT